MKRSGSATASGGEAAAPGEVGVVYEEILVDEHMYDPNKKMKREQEGRRLQRGGATRRDEDAEEEEAAATEGEEGRRDEDAEEGAATEGEKGRRDEGAEGIVQEKKRPTKRPSKEKSAPIAAKTHVVKPPLPPPPPPPSSSAASSSSAAAPGDGAKSPGNWSAKCKALVEKVLFSSEEEARKYAKDIYAGDQDL